MAAIHGAVGPMRIRSLDGLRCLSIMTVVMSHIALYEGIGTHTALKIISELGRTGVTIFFVISGFLITTLLLEERATSGGIHLGRFYLRRAFRIFPAYFTMLAMVAIVGSSNLRSLLVSAFFMRDYRLGAVDFALAHTWSLGVEEKFYLLWPLAVMLLSPRWLRALCVGLLVVSPLVRVATYILDPGVREIIAVMFQTRADTIAIGCLLALVWDRPAFGRICDKILGAPLGMAAFVTLFFVSPTLTTVFRGYYLLPVGLSLDGLAAAILLTWSIRSTSSYGDLLNARPIVFVGVLSYSIYLWQQMALDPTQHWLGKLPSRLAFGLAAALLSYFLVEQPFIAVRRYLNGSWLPSPASSRADTPTQTERNPI